MKFPLSWLKEYVDVELPTLQIAKILTLAGIEVDAVIKADLNFDHVVVAEILSVEPHPNADKLVLAKVSDGFETFDVVCGAPNCRVGMKVALALIGATLTLPNGEKIKVKKSKIRGVESFGMLCSGYELGISQDSEGIVEFAEHLKPGADVGELYSDTIFEVSLTPNLNHSASLIGIARELSAATGAPLKMPLISLSEVDPEIKKVMRIDIQNKKDCTHYTCRVVEGDMGKESPEWMQKRLIACGLRPINLAADVTNYVLMEMGQPLHAFDFDKIEGHQIIVRSAYHDEKITTLDGKERVCSKEMLLIADQKQPLAIAGVIGGMDSSVSTTTKKVVIESAYFRPGSIRKTSKAFALSTDSSRRFERGVDPLGVLPALDRAAMLLQELSEGRILRGVLQQQSEKCEPLELTCRIHKVNALLGTILSTSEVEEILRRLGFKTRSLNQDTLHVVVPTYRVDVKAEVDLIEEVARLIGYDNIPRHEVQHSTSLLPNNPVYLFEREVRTRLIEEGLQEFLTCDLIGPSLLDIVKDPKVPDEAYVKVINPTSIEQSIMRTSLLQGLLQVVKFNHDRENPNVAGFEVGRVHFKTKDHYEEPSVAGIIIAGKNRPHHIDPKPRDVDFYDLKGIIENLLEGLNIKRFSFRFSNLETFHTGRQALIQVDGIDIGSMGEIHPSIQRKLDVSSRIYFAELSLVDLVKAKRGDLKLKPISEYPSSERDWTVSLKEAFPIQQIVGSIQHIPSKLLEEVTLKDIFRSEGLGRDLKNVTLHFVYRDKSKTISQEEVDEEHARIIKNAEKMLEPI